MVLEIQGRAPYAPAATVIPLIERHVQTSLPSVIDLGVLERYGVTEGLRPRTLATLKLLDFITEEGSLTPEFDALKRVARADVPARLGEMLRNTYSPVFQIIGDPANATTQQIEDAFKAFEPRGQIVRMVQLFTGLMVYTGQMPEDARRKPGPKTSAPEKKTSPRKGATTQKATTLAPKKPVDPVDPVKTAQDFWAEKPAHAVQVDLGAAGTVTLMVAVNPLALTKDDRTAFYAIVDALNEWRATASPQQTSPAAPASQGGGIG